MCVLALAAPDAATEIFEGRVYGTLDFPPRGKLGFGYDPIFIPEGHRFTFGEMDPKEKHAISHRARPSTSSWRPRFVGHERLRSLCSLAVSALSKCPYCDFNSHVRERFSETRWSDAILRELGTVAGMQTERPPVASIFFGGGTPSLDERPRRRPRARRHRETMAHR